MTHTVTLIVCEDEYDSEPGLAPKGMDTKFEGFMASRSGLLVAHDVLEHVNGVEAIGGVPDELEALGALWQVRGRHGDMLDNRNSMWTAEQSVASDISRMARDLTGADTYWPGATHIEPEPEHDFDDEFAVIITDARRQIIAELDEDELSDFPMEAYLADAMHLLRRGFRKAEALYGDYFGGANIFIAVRDAVDRIKREIQFEGQEFLLTIDIEEGVASCQEVIDEPEADDDD